MRGIGFSLGVAAAIFWSSSAQAQCLSGGAINICENPIDGSSPEANVVGGTLLSNGGFRIDQKGDRVTFDLGTTATAGTVRFSISNVSLANLNQDTHLLLLITDTPELKPTPPNYLLELKIWGTKVDPNAGGITRIGVGDGVQESTKSAGKLTWTAGTTYEMDVSWNEATQTVKLLRNGAVLANFKTGDLIPGTSNPPIAMRYRYVHLAMPYLSSPMFWPVMKSVYKMASITAEPATPSSGGAGGTGGVGGEGGSAGAPGGGGVAGGGGAAGAPEYNPGGGATNNIAGASAGGSAASGGAGGWSTGGTTSGTPGNTVDADGSTTESDEGGCSVSPFRSGSTSAALVSLVIAIGIGAERRRRGAR